MSDLDDLEAVAGLPENSGRTQRRRYRASGELETHCRRGHALTPDNIYYRQAGQYTLRHCKKCARLRLLCRED